MAFFFLFGALVAHAASDNEDVALADPAAGPDDCGRGRGIGRGGGGLDAARDPRDSHGHDGAARQDSERPLRGKGRGRGRHGAFHSEASRLRIARGRQRAAAKKLRECRNKLSLSFSERASRAAFGMSVDAKDAVMRNNTDWFDIGGGCRFSLNVDRHASNERDVDRCLASHVLQQARGLSQMLSSRANALVAVFRNVFDDAAMWIQKPGLDSQLPAWERGGGPKAKERQKKLGKRGRNIHAPVLNLQEEIVCVPLASASQARRWVAAEVFSSATPMPQANFGTVYSRWRRWSILNGHAPGRSVDPEGCLKPVVEQLGWKVLVLVKDSLYLNSLIEGSLSQSIFAQKAFTMLSINCTAHSAVLAMKPTMNRLQGLSSNMVRLGNLFQSGRWAERFQAALLEESKDAEFVEVLELPPEASAWNETTRTILELSRPALDMSADDEDFVAMIDNANWASPKIVHLHVRGVCPCGGRENFPQNVRECVRLSLGRGCEQCLLYRWKGFGKTRSILDLSRSSPTRLVEESSSPNAFETGPRISRAFARISSA